MLPFVKCFVLFLCFVFIDGVRFRCDYKFDEIGWFKYHEMPATWYDARSICNSEGGVLASPKTFEMNVKLMEIMEGKYIYTGIHATFSKGQFYTIDGTQLSDIPHEWAADEPNNDKNAQDCIILDSESKFHDINCHEPYPYICYREFSNVDTNICGTPDPDYHFDTRTGNCYKFHPGPRTFDRAHLSCSAEGGHLAIINSEEEAQVIREVYARYPDSKLLGYYHRKDLAYIGFHNWGENGDWRTIQGQTLEQAGYAKWYAGEPNNVTGGESCGSVYRNGLLNDLWCFAPFAFICEKKPHFPPVCDHITGKDCTGDC